MKSTKTETKQPNSYSICPALSYRRMTVARKRNKKKKRGSPDDTSRYCSGKVIAPPSCKQSSRDKGGKN